MAELVASQQIALQLQQFTEKCVKNLSLGPVGSGSLEGGEQLDSPGPNTQQFPSLPLLACIMASTDRFTQHINLQKRGGGGMLSHSRPAVMI